MSFINISWFPFKIFQQSLLFRYFYAISSDVAIEHPGRLVKVDTKTSKVKPVTVESYVSLKSLQVESWSEDNCYCSEPVYIAEPAEAAAMCAVSVSIMSLVTHFHDNTNLK